VEVYAFAGKVNYKHFTIDFCWKMCGICRKFSHLSKMMQLQDQSARDAFGEVIEKNFSVIAPAGVGKTTAITERIANFIVFDAQTASDERSLAKKLAAVTYTVKAAHEIRDRVFSRIFQKTEHSRALREACMRRVEFAFFGTIHAFASKFLKLHCPVIGLRDDFEIVSDEDAAWAEFIENFGDPLAIVPQSVRGDFRCFHDIDRLLSDGKNYNSTAAVGVPAILNAPPVDIAGIMGYVPTPRETQISKFLQLLEEWDTLRRGGDFFPMPNFCDFCSGESFAKFCEGKLAPLVHWKEISKKVFVKKIAGAYWNFRVMEGKLRHGDLIDLSVELLKDGGVISSIEDAPFRVILDEAQDTDEQQFRFLLGVSQKVLRGGISIDTVENFPEGGHFSMVGDPQQSIYERADVKTYMKLHDSLLKSGAAEGITFSVTMRCPRAVVDFVNGRFSKIFSGSNFVKLVAKPDSASGAVEILKLEKENCALKNESGGKAADPAALAAKLFENAAPSDFGVEKWADVAILAPRKEWLMDIAKSFASDGTFPQIQLHFPVDGGNVASPIRWLSACLRYVNNPVDGREFAGILRELFGIGSREIIDHFKRRGNAECAAIDAAFSSLRRERYSIPLGKFLLKILDEFMIFQRIRALGIYSDAAFSEEVKRTIELCYFAESSGMDISAASDFLESKINGDYDLESADPNAVQFLTFHKSKGLEWPVVVLPFMARRRKIPQCAQTGNGHSENAHGNESRLLYVACTRTKKTLIMLDDSSFFAGNLPANETSSRKILLE
jgi:ATP-dependent exoDNAse (exonuclease V) beta subunit